MSEIKTKIDQFIEHFELLGHIDPKHTNRRLIKVLFSSFLNNYHGSDWVDRGGGTTTTIAEWLKWTECDAVVVTCAERCYRRHGHRAQNWRQRIEKLDAPEFVIFDSPLTLKERNSSVILDKWWNEILWMGHAGCKIINISVKGEGCL